MSESHAIHGTSNEHEVVDPVQLRRATLASSVGSALEYYDFYIYGLASALIFGELFFKPLGAAGVESALVKDHLIIPEASPVEGELSVAFTPTDQRVLAATFEAWPDDTTGRWAFFGDELAS